eukprot:TRINITY_DN34126_c0_g1_i1.p1 TRINITY_DN34126_c0_g1~~TRINITY_DN34126_c0_g1_i1.p1  ORF type:complete len:531 (+),score=93.90 TRINITY_DN34126_c0_g1_i1:78-1595(+)
MACPVPYILAGAWLARKVPELAQEKSGRLILTAAAFGLTSAAYVVQKAWRLGHLRLPSIILRSLPPALAHVLRPPSLPRGVPLRRFGITEVGFVPHPADVVKRLPPAFDAWEDVAQKLPELARSREIRDIVDAWPDLDLALLRSGDNQDDDEAAVRRAYSLLAMISHAYVWCDQADPEDVLPAALAVPFHEAATLLGLPPVLTHAAVDLWNWEVVPPNEEEVPVSVLEPSVCLQQDAFRCLNTMTGTKDEEWFYCTSTAVQILLGPVVVGAYSVFSEAVPAMDCVAVSGFLSDCLRGLEEANKVMDRLSQHTTSEVFWNDMRPFLQGFGDVAGLEDGLVYEGVSAYAGKPQKFAGASAAQSTAIPVVDCVLGVVHSGREAEFMLQMRKYMPAKHREYLELLKTQEPLRAVLQRWRKMVCPDVTVAEIDRMIDLFNECIDALVRFRRIHFRHVNSHILMPKSQEASRSSGCMGGAAIGPAKGTGGSPLEEFLMNTVNATLAARIAT